MSQTTPTPVDALPAAPSTSNPSTFSALADAFIAALAAFRTQINAIATNVYGNAVDTYNNTISTAASAVAAAVSETRAAASATAAANSATAAAWVSGNTYALNALAVSSIDFQPYRKITASSMTTIDPASDPANWAPQGWLRTVTITGTSATATAGQRLVLTNSAATNVTTPVAAEGVEFEIVPANGLKTNAVDFGVKSVVGPNGSASGLVTLNLGAALRARFNSTIDKWVVLS